MKSFDFLREPSVVFVCSSEITKIECDRLDACSRHATRDARHERRETRDTRHETRDTRQDKTRHDTTRQDKTRQDKTRQDKTRQDTTRQDKTRQDTTRHRAAVRNPGVLLPFSTCDCTSAGLAPGCNAAPTRLWPLPPPISVRLPLLSPSLSSSSPSPSLAPGAS
eukprot:22808-Rhodomonas_salina.1